MRLPFGTILLIIVAILAYFGLLHRVLDRMRLSDTAALVIALLMAAGTFLDIPISRGNIQVRANVGGAIIPLALVIWLVATADEASEKASSVFAVLATGVVVWGLTKVMSPEEQFMSFSPMLAFGIAAGIVAAVAGRSRRAAFAGGIGGILVADIIHLVELSVRKMPGAVAFGGAGTFDATVVAGILAVALVELVGEIRERAVKTGGGRGNESEK